MDMEGAEADANGKCNRRGAASLAQRPQGAACVARTDKVMGRGHRAERGCSRILGEIASTSEGIQVWVGEGVIGRESGGEGAFEEVDGAGGEAGFAGVFDEQGEGARGVVEPVGGLELDQPLDVIRRREVSEPGAGGDARS